MSNYVSVLKLLIKNMFRRDMAKEKSLTKTLLVGLSLLIAYAAIGFLFVTLIYFMGSTFAAFSLQSEFISMILACGLMVVLIFGIVTVLTCLYFSKDTEFFFALPIKPATIFAAKLTVVYLIELSITALIMLPCLIAAGIVMNLSAIFYVIMPFAVLFTPVIPLVLASVIAIPVMYIVSFLKNRGALGSIVVILLFGGFFGLYYAGISQMQNMNPEEIDLSGMQDMFRKIASTMYPLYALARAMTATPVFGLGTAASVAVNLAIYFGIVLALGAIVMLISSAVYRRGASGQLEGAKRNKTANVAYRGSGTLKALMKKEWREILRTPAFALNCLLGIVMCPIIVVFFGLTTKTSATAGEMMNQPESQILIMNTVMRFVMLWFVMFMSVGTNAGPATALSREGEKFYYTKIIPVDYKTQLRAKSYVYIIIGSLSSIFGAIAMAAIDFNAVFFIFSLMFLLIYNFAAVHLGMLLDVNNPKLKWTTPNEAVKHNKNVVATVFGSMLVSMLLAVGGGILSVVLMRWVSGTVANVISMCTLLAVGIAAAVWLFVTFYKNCEKKIDEIEV